MREVILQSAAKLSDGTVIRFARIRSANDVNAGPPHNELAATDHRDGKLAETVRMRTPENVQLQSSMDFYVGQAVKQIEKELAKIADHSFDPVDKMQVVESYPAFAMALRRRPVKEAEA